MIFIQFFNHQSFLEGHSLIASSHLVLFLLSFPYLGIILGIKKSTQTKNFSPRALNYRLFIKNGKKWKRSGTFCRLSYTAFLLAFFLNMNIHLRIRNVDPLFIHRQFDFLQQSPSGRPIIIGFHPGL